MRLQDAKPRSTQPASAIHRSKAGSASVITLEDLAAAAMLATSLHMIPRSLHLFCAALLTCATSVSQSAELKTGSVASLTFEDVDGNQLSTADGHVTIITV